MQCPKEGLGNSNVFWEIGGVRHVLLRELSALQLLQLRCVRGLNIIQERLDGDGECYIRVIEEG